MDGPDYSDIQLHLTTDDTPQSPRSTPTPTSTPIASLSPPHCIFVIPELLLEILQKLSSAELVTAALVCKDWSPTALDVLWRSKEVPCSALWKVLPGSPEGGGTDDSENAVRIYQLSPCHTD